MTVQPIVAVDNGLDRVIRYRHRHKPVKYGRNGAINCSPWREFLSWMLLSERSIALESVVDMREDLELADFSYAQCEKCVRTTKRLPGRQKIHHK